MECHPSCLEAKSNQNANRKEDEIFSSRPNSFSDYIKKLKINKNQVC